MLDLKVLEALVDQALSNETESTLVEWLSEQRNANLFSYYGRGDVESIGCFSHRNFEVSKVGKMDFSSPQESHDIVNSYANFGLSIAA